MRLRAHPDTLSETPYNVLNELTWWERYLCGYDVAKTHMNNVRAFVKANLLWQALGAAALLVTVATESRLHESDYWDALDIILATPTLIWLHSRLRDVPAAATASEERAALAAAIPEWMTHWCWCVAVAHGIGIVIDVIGLVLAPWRRSAARFVSLVTDALSLLVWLQFNYFLRNELLLRILGWPSLERGRDDEAGKGYYTGPIL